MRGHLVFETAMGFAALAWSGDGLTRFALPQKTREAASRLAAGWPAEPEAAGFSAKSEATGPEAADLSAAPAFVAETVALVRRYAQGEAVDLSALPFVLAGVEPFDRAVYAAALTLGFGEVTTYGELAGLAGFPKMARETGAALGRNPLPLVIPCHRILAAGGRIGGFSAPGGAATKQRLLAHEGVDLSPPPPAQASFAF